MFSTYRQQNLCELDIVLLGRTGNGKSATGNSILNKCSFNSSSSFSSVTKFPQYDACEFSGWKIQVVDCPGIFDPDLDSIQQEAMFSAAIKNILLANTKGYHAFLIIVRYGNRFTKEESKTIQILKQALGDDFLAYYGIIVMTNGDEFKEKQKTSNIATFCRDQTGDFKELLKDCKNRIVLFDNKSDNESVKRQQREELVTCIKNLNNDNKRYSNKHFEHLDKHFGAEAGVLFKDIINKQSCILDRVFKNSTAAKRRTFDLNVIVQEITVLESSVRKNAPSGAKLTEYLNEARTFLDERKQIFTDANTEQEQVLLKELQDLHDKFVRIKVIFDELYYSCFEKLEIQGLSFIEKCK